MPKSPTLTISSDVRNKFCGLRSAEKIIAVKKNHKNNNIRHIGSITNKTNIKH